MSTIITRAGKGSPLTNNEVDANFVNLNTDKVETVTSADGSIVVLQTGTNIDLAVSAASPASTLLTQVRNTTGATLTKGTVVYISGATGQISTVSKAIASGDSTSAQTLGMITANLANNSNGYVTVFGLLQNMDTSAYTDGAQLYLSGTVAGAVTATKPSAPIHLVYVAVVEYAHPTQGKLLVKVQNGYELAEIHDVSIVSPTTGQTLVYDSVTDLWSNSNAPTITGGTINNTTIGATTPSTGVFTTLTAQNETLKGTGQNLILRSQQFSNVVYSSSTATRTDNQTTAPDGTSTGALIQAIAGSYGGLVRQFNAPYVPNTTYTISVYAKAGTSNFVGLRASGGCVSSGDNYCYFNLSTGVATAITPISGAIVSVAMTNAGNGWYRCSVAYTTGATISNNLSDFSIVTSTGGTNPAYAGTETIFAWGFQVELGSVLNTYIPTTTTAVYGTPTLSFSGVASIGLQSDGSLYETSAGTGNVRFYTNNIGQEQARVSHTASAVNAINLTGGATTKGVIQSAQGSDSNISYVTQSKGTGAIDLAAGSSGVNISNGGTVTAITRTANGTGYTSIPSVAITAPTTAGGVQATATATMFAITATVQAGGTGYAVGNVLTVVGGTYSSQATFTVSAVSAGVVTAVTLTSGGTAYSVLPTNPVSTTGGTGTGATLNITSWGVSTIPVGTAGSGYVEQPTVTFSGGGGSGAAAYATVGSGTTVRSLGASTELLVDTSTILHLRAKNTSGGNPTNTSAAFGLIPPQSNFGAPVMGFVSGPYFSWGGTGAMSFSSNASNPATSGNSGSEQFRISHTASAVNYVQVTGAATGGRPAISVQGSDANAGLWVQAKGTGNIRFDTRTGASIGFLIADSGSAVNANWMQVTGSAAGSAPVLSAQGTDTNIPAVVQPKGTGALQAQQTDSTATGGNARGANAVDWQTLRGAASQVASGQLSAVLSGASNTAANVYSAVMGGNQHTVNTSYSSISGGLANTITGNIAAFGFVGGGYANTSSGVFNFIGGGYTNSGTSASAVTTQSATMNGTTAVTLSGSNASIKVGQLVSGTSITSFPNTYVAAISGTSLTLSQAASGSSTSTLSFFTPHGVVVGGGNNQATGSYSFIGGGGDAGTAANRNVASGDYAVVVGGRTNTASGIASFVGGGGFDGASVLGNIASSSFSAVVGGAGNAASGFGSFVGGGAFNSASGTYSSALCGNASSASGTGSSVLSGYSGTARAITGNTVFAASQNPISSTQGGSQAALLVFGVQTTDATATVLRSNTSAASTTNQVILPNNSAYYFKVEIIANVTGGGNTSGWELKGVIKRGANAASTAIVGSVTSTLIAQDAGASTWVVSATADTTNGGLKITVTGQASTTIRWVAKASTTEVTF